MSINTALCQLNFTTGDIEGNYNKIFNYFQKYSQTSDLIIFPELALTGYDAQDLFYKNHFIKACEDKIIQLSQATEGQNCQIILGAPHLIIDKNHQRRLFNAAFILADGEVKNIIHKNGLPNYGVFDEKRYFTAGQIMGCIKVKDQKFGVLICEDLWKKENIFLLQEMNIDGVIAINASPFHAKKQQQRTEVAQYAAKNLQKPVIYLNQIGGQDSLVFDGGSFILGSDGERLLQMNFFEEDVKNFSLDDKLSKHKLQNLQTENENIYQAMILGLRDYVHKTAFEEVLIGMSGGIDSALVATIAVDAFGSENVSLVALPSKFNSELSFQDAKNCANNLGIKLEVISIEPMFQQMKSSLSDIFVGFKEDKTEENIQSRIRGNILMAISNKFNQLLLTTGNKSEIAVGYATIYGDMCGAFNPIKDLYKTQVSTLAKWRNKNIPKISIYKKTALIPSSIITKEPSAELSLNQKDSDSLPEYDILDQILFLLIEKELSIEEVIEEGFAKELVTKITKLLHSNEFKRKQAALGPILSPMSFDLERRYPICYK
ncbi:NAD+ synthase [Flavobacteriaceae bacterium]|nr:NAD+ synthase [Flavobacteriaceae bacterium]